MNDPKNIERLWQKYLRGNCTKEEFEQLMDWLQNPENEAQAKFFMGKDWRKMIEQEPNSASDINQAFQKVNLTIAKEEKAKSINRRFALFRIAASVALVLGLGWGIYQLLPISQEYLSAQALQSVVTKEQQGKVTLQDGTIVRLNQHSKLIYPKHFASDQRKVTLEGEAYFEVAKNPNQPFIITVQEATIKVLGTSFNVKENLHDTTLLVAVMEGKVALAYQHNPEKRQILTRNYLGVMKNGEIHKTELNDINNYLSWASRRLVFNETVLPAVIQQLENIYEVEIELQDPGLEDMVLTMDVPRRSIENVLDDIAKSLNLKVIKKRDIFLLEEV